MMPATTCSRTRIARTVLLLALVSMVLVACVSAGENGASRTVAYIPGYQNAAPIALGYEDPAKTGSVVQVALNTTSATQMSIDLSQSFAPEGQVSFLVTNTADETHEFVVLATDTPADAFPIVTFEGEPDRIDEDATGVTNLGETGDMEAGTSMMLTLDLAPGHYAVVCNLQGHYAAGMHQDFWVTPADATPVQVALNTTSATQMSIDLSQSFAPEGQVSFLVTNTADETHEFVVLATDTPADAFPIVVLRGRAGPDRRGRDWGDQPGRDRGHGGRHLDDAHP